MDQGALAPFSGSEDRNVFPMPVTGRAWPWARVWHWRVYGTGPGEIAVSGRVWPRVGMAGRGGAVCPYGPHASRPRPP